MDGEYCYLGDPSWTPVLQSLVSDDPMMPDRNERNASFAVITIGHINFLRDCTTLFADLQRGRDSYVVHELRCRDLRAQHKAIEVELRHFAQRWAAYLGRRFTEDEFQFKFGHGDRELALAVKVAEMESCRLDVALGGHHQLARECQAQALARELLDEVDTAGSRIAGPNAVTSRATANAVLATAEEWLAFCNEPDTNEAVGLCRVISPAVFLRWVRFHGIRLPDGCDVDG